MHQIGVENIAQTRLCNILQFFMDVKTIIFRRKNIFPYFCSKQIVINEYPQSMFKSKNEKIMYTPVNPNFTIQKLGVRGSTLHRHVPTMKLQQ